MQLLADCSVLESWLLHDEGCGSSLSFALYEYRDMQGVACCKALDNDLALADISELKGALVSVAPEAGIKQIHSPTQVAHRQARAISLPANSSHTVQILYLRPGNLVYLLMYHQIHYWNCDRDNKSAGSKPTLCDIPDI